MTDRLSAPQWDELAEAMAEAGHEYDRITRAFRRRGDEAARRKAEQEGSLECPACGGSGHIDDFKARREAEGGIPADHLQHAVETMPEAARGFAKLAASLSDAPPPPAPDYDAMVKELRAKQVWPIVTADFFRFLEDQRNRSADAIEALSAERDAANDARGKICADLIAAQYKIAKLRGALKKIAANSEDAADPNLSPSDSYGNGDDVFRDGMRQADFYTAQIARAALAQGGNDG